MKNFMENCKRRWSAFLERMAKANQDHYGSSRLDCCDLNQKKKIKIKIKTKIK